MGTINKIVCCVCKKLIKNNKYKTIGKNFVGLKLHHHNKCKLYHLSMEELEYIKTCKEIRK